MLQHPLTYQALIERFGKEMAFDFLLVVERLARIRDDVSFLDEEARLLNALERLDATNKDLSASFSADPQLRTGT